MKNFFGIGQWRPALVALVLTAPMLAACAKTDVSVPIHGVNHRAEAFRYVLVDPTNAKNTGGGELIEPFSAGGTMCCYTLPAKWRPGIKIEIRETHWLPKPADDSLPEVSKKYLVEVPQYAAGKAGELWVIRASDGSMSVVSSNFQPDHLRWPGNIKGWPVPSTEYQRKIQDMYIKHAREGVELYVSSLKELKENPHVHARDEWEMSLKYSPSGLKSYSGPDDPAYLDMLRKKYELSLVAAKAKLDQEESARP